MMARALLLRLSYHNFFDCSASCGPWRCNIALPLPPPGGSSLPLSSLFSFLSNCFNMYLLNSLSSFLLPPSRSLTLTLGVDAAPRPAAAAGRKGKERKGKESKGKERKGKENTTTGILNKCINVSYFTLLYLPPLSYTHIYTGFYPAKVR